LLRIPSALHALVSSKQICCK